MGKLLTISLVLSLIGIFLILIFALHQGPKRISAYASLNANDYVETTSKILSIKTYDEFNIIKLENNISVVCFKCSFNQSQTIKVQGKVSEYKGEKQINAETIEVIR